MYVILQLYFFVSSWMQIALYHYKMLKNVEAECTTLLSSLEIQWKIL